MKKIILFIVAFSFGVAGTYMVIEKMTQAKVLEVQMENTSIKNELFGYTKLTDYIAAGKKVLTEQSEFMAVKVTHEYDLVEHLQTGRFGLTSNASRYRNQAWQTNSCGVACRHPFEIRNSKQGFSDG